MVSPPLHRGGDNAHRLLHISDFLKWTHDSLAWMLWIGLLPWPVAKPDKPSNPFVPFQDVMAEYECGGNVDGHHEKENESRMCDMQDIDDYGADDYHEECFKKIYLK